MDAVRWKLIRDKAILAALCIGVMAITVSVWAGCLLPFFGTGAPPTGSGSGAGTWSSWSGRNEPGGPTAYVVQMASGVAGDGETGYGFGGNYSLTDATGTISGSDAYGVRTVVFDTTAKWFQFSDSMRTAILPQIFGSGDSKWTVIMSVSGYQRDVCATNAPLLYLNQGSQRVDIRQSDIYWNFPCNKVLSLWVEDAAGNGVSAYAISAPPATGNFYIYAWSSGVTYGIGWATAKCTKWTEIPGGQKGASILTTVRLSPNFVASDYARFAESDSASDSMGVKWLWLSNSCEIN